MERTIRRRNLCARLDRPGTIFPFHNRREKDTMDLAQATQLIGSLGFPIVACIMLYVQMTKQDENHKAEVKQLTDAINNNTLVMQKLCDRLGVEFDREN